MLQKINPADFSKIKRMTIGQLTVWVNTLYCTAFEDGLREGEKEFDDSVILEDSDVLKILVECGISRKKAELVLEKLIEGGNNEQK